jgi:ubiquinone/menaquinone biosynthesis C-methylase UbiE
MSAFKHHDMLPTPGHDEQARQDFVASLRGHLSGRLMPGAYQLYERRVGPALRTELGREPDETEVRRAMTREPYYQFWSAMQRRSQEMLWESVIDPTERELPALIERAKSRRKAGAKPGATRRGATARPRRPLGSLRLDPTLPLPRYHAAVDIHLQPGAYHTDSTADDVAAGVIYDKGLDLYMGGALGAENGLMGETLVAYLKERHPSSKPRRILDMGCAIGNSTVVWARAFPQAEVHGIDVGAPVLRYAHARAEGFGAPVHFSQQDAERTDFEAGSFDLVVSHIMLHETSKPALPRIFAECRRLLRPGGLMLHLEIPRGHTVFEQFMHNWESYNNNETFSRYMTHIDLAAEAVRGGFARPDVRVDEFAMQMSVAQMNYAENFIWKILAAER